MVYVYFSFMGLNIYLTNFEQFAPGQSDNVDRIGALVTICLSCRNNFILHKTVSEESSTVLTLFNILMLNTIWIIRVIFHFQTIFLCYFFAGTWPSANIGDSFDIACFVISILAI